MITEGPSKPISPWSARSCLNPHLLNLDDADELRAAYAIEKNKTGQRSSWVNPDNGNQVAVTPTKTYQVASGEYCREYQTEVVVGGKTEQAYGTACRQPDGQWKIVR